MLKLPLYLFIRICGTILKEEKQKVIIIFFGGNVNEHNMYEEELASVA